MEIAVSLEYKTGDEVDTPYAEYPVNKEFSEPFRRHGWKVEGQRADDLGIQVLELRQNNSRKRIEVR